MGWSVIVHKKAEDEIDDLPPEVRAKLARILKMMLEIGPQNLHAPHVKSLGNKLLEIRLTGRDGIARVIYAIFSNKRIALLHAFIKKTQKTPLPALECAFKRRKELKDEEFH